MARGRPDGALPRCIEVSRRGGVVGHQDQHLMFGGIPFESALELGIAALRHETPRRVEGRPTARRSTSVLWMCDVGTDGETDSLLARGYAAARFARELQARTASP